MKKKAISSSRQIEALLSISKAITSDLYLEDILRLIVTVAAQVLKSKICSLMLIDEKTNNLVIRTTQSVSETYNKKPPLKVGEGIAGKAAKENKSQVVFNVNKEKEYRYKNIAKKEGLYSLLCVPLAVKGKVIGVINNYTSSPHKFTKTEIDVLITVANQAAIVIENASLLVQSKVVKEELEMRKLIERAKGLLMKEENLSEQEAFRKIQKTSMNLRKSMRDIAEAIILSSEVKK
ncbi:MAG: GAF and ANTAR domain-containing protein [Candidatus Omnitrophota bacterium]|nr:GAF and ANTAR domain-containing protein [Candidatus Omnitrophota bacterium]